MMVTFAWPATFAHRLEAVSTAGALELVEQRDHEAGAGRAERVPERDRAAVDVDLLVFEVGLAQPRHRHRGERLVDLDEVDVARLQTGLGECPLRGGDRRREHHDRVVGPAPTCGGCGLAA